MSIKEKVPRENEKTRWTSDQKIIEKVQKFIEANPTDSYKKLAENLTTNEGLNIGTMSVHNIAKKLGIKSYNLYYKPRKEQMIPANTEIARTNFATVVVGQEFRNKFQFKICFVDESLIDCSNISVNKQTTRYKAYELSEVPASWHKKYAKALKKTNLNCFAALIFGRRPFISFIDGHDNTENYKNVSSDLFENKQFNFVKNEHVYFHDGAGYHYSYETLEFLQEKAGENVISKWRPGSDKHPEIKFEKMPEYASYSPYLNPVDYRDFY